MEPEQTTDKIEAEVELIDISDLDPTLICRQPGTALSAALLRAADEYPDDAGVYAAWQDGPPPPSSLE